MRERPLHNLYRENKLQAPTKTIVTYERIDIRSYNFHHRVHHEQGNQLMGRFSFTRPSSLHTKAEFMKKKNRSRMIAST